MRLAKIELYFVKSASMRRIMIRKILFLTVMALACIEGSAADEIRVGYCRA